MIPPLGYARALAPLEGALAAMAEGAVFEAVVQGRTGEGRYRVSIAGVPVELETPLAFAARERLRVTVASREPLTLAISRLPAAGTAVETNPLPGAAAAPLPPELEAAVRGFSSPRPGDTPPREGPGLTPEGAVREGAARWLAVRGLGFDPRLAAGLVSLALHPAGAASLLERASRAITTLSPAGLAAAPTGLPSIGSPAEFASFLAHALAAPSEGSPPAAGARLMEAAARILEGPSFDALDSPGDPAAREALKRHPAAAAIGEALGSARELADRGAAVRLLNADAAARGAPTQLIELAWISAGRFESAALRVTRDGRRSPESPDSLGVSMVVSMSRLGLVRAAIDLAAGNASVSLVAALPAARRFMLRRQGGLVEALVRLGLRASVRVTEGPLEDLDLLRTPGVDLTG